MSLLENGSVYSVRVMSIQAMRIMRVPNLEEPGLVRNSAKNQQTILQVQKAYYIRSKVNGVFIFPYGNTTPQRTQGVSYNFRKGVYYTTVLFSAKHLSSILSSVLSCLPILSNSTKCITTADDITISNSSSISS